MEKAEKTLKTLLSSYAEAERTVNEYTDKLISELKGHISETPAAGVTPVAGGIRAVTVPVSRAWTNLTPEYWIPECQAEAVEKKLRSAATPLQCLEWVLEMLRTKAVVCNKIRTPLNDKTVEIIRESELGRSAAEYLKGGSV